MLKKSKTSYLVDILDIELEPCMKQESKQNKRKGSDTAKSVRFKDKIEENFQVMKRSRTVEF